MADQKVQGYLHPHKIWEAYRALSVHCFSGATGRWRWDSIRDLDVSTVLWIGDDWASIQPAGISVDSAAARRLVGTNPNGRYWAGDREAEARILSVTKSGMENGAAALEVWVRVYEQHG